MKTIKAVPLAEAREGMTLAAEVRDEAGQMLLAEKTLLNAARIDSLAKRGVGVVLVEEERHLTEDEKQALQAEVRARVAHIFRQAGDEPVMQRLKAAILAHRLREVDA